MQENATDGNYLLAGKSCSVLTERVGGVGSVLKQEINKLTKEQAGANMVQTFHSKYTIH